MRITIYYIRDTKEDPPWPRDELFYDNRESIEERMRNLSNGFQRLSEVPRYTVGEFEISDKCKCDDYMQTTMILLKLDGPNGAQIVGTSNLIGVYKLIGAELGWDVEAGTNGKYELVSKPYFDAHYRITKAS